VARSKEVIEGWTGPGRRDSLIEALQPAEDGLHIEPGRRGSYEWWYFDTHLENGYTLVVFFHASNPNPGLEGRIGVEIVLLRPDGVRVQRFIRYGKPEFSAARDRPEVTIGPNTLRARPGDDGLPVYEIEVREPGLGCRLTYRAQVDGWKPGTGLSQFGDLGTFGWVIPFARAAVEGTITDGGQTFPVRGIGYHDHNWLDFRFATIIEYWMWGRIYSENHTVSYAYIQCNDQVDRHAVRVLMLAEGRQVVLSTGEFEFIEDDFEFNARAKHAFPRRITIDVPGELKATLQMKRVLEAQNMLENFNPLLRTAARFILRIQPGYFRLLSGFELQVTQAGKTVQEHGETLHEIVLFKPIQQESA